jgi:hypothetical protein
MASTWVGMVLGIRALSNRVSKLYVPQPQQAQPCSGLTLPPTFIQLQVESGG